MDVDNKLVGIIIDGDLLRRVQDGNARDRTIAVQDVMTRDVITIADTTALEEVANLLMVKRIKRAPVVRNGEVIVS